MKFVILLVVLVALFAPSQQGPIDMIKSIPSRIKHMFDSSDDHNMSQQDKMNTLKPPSYDMKPNQDQSYQIPKPSMSMDMSMDMSRPNMPSYSMNQPSMPSMSSPNMGMDSQMRTSYDSMGQQMPQVKVERKIKRGSDSSDETTIETSVTDLRTGEKKTYETEIKNE